MTWKDSAWNYKQKLTLDTSELAANVTDDMPIVVIVDDTNTDFWDHCAADGKDVRVSNAAEDAWLDYHFEQFNHTTDDMVLWFEGTDTFNAATDIDLYLYYGNAGAVDAQNAANTYSADFKAVYHMDDASGGIDNIEGTAAYDGTEAGDPTYAQSGKIGDCIDFDGTGDYFDLNFELGGESQATVMAWVRLDTGGQRGIIASHDGVILDGYVLQNSDTDHWDLYFSSGGVLYRVTSSDATNTAQWYHVAITQDGTDNKLVVDGVEKDSTPFTGNIPTTGYNYYLGAANAAGVTTTEIDGKIDEVKFMTTGLSVDAIKLIYLSESDTLITFGAEETEVAVRTYKAFPAVEADGVLQI